MDHENTVAVLFALGFAAPAHAKTFRSCCNKSRFFQPPPCVQAASEWGLIIIALLFMTGRTVESGRCQVHPGAAPAIFSRWKRRSARERL